MFNNLLTKILLILLIVACSIGIYFYIQNNNFKKDNINKENSIKVLSQNIVAMKDSISQKADSIQNLAIFVTNLKAENIIKNSKYNILHANYTILQDSLTRLSGIATTTITDTSVKVYFSGEKNSIKYSGFTNYNLLTKISNYDISLFQNPILISNLVYIDSSNILRSDIFSNGKYLSNVKTEIDSSVYLKIMSNNYNKNNKKTFFDKLNIFGNAEYNNNDKILTLQIGMMYQFDNGFYPYIKKELNSSMIIYGIGCSESIRNLFSKF
jgi:hypothetical protein